jgi:hypothetical protein
VHHLEPAAAAAGGGGGPEGREPRAPLERMLADVAALEPARITRPIPSQNFWQLD